MTNKKQTVEVIKLYDRGLQGRKKWVMSDKDLHRFLNKYNFTLTKFLGLGIGRAVWNNTLEYYQLDVNDIEALRKTPYKQTLYHGNSEMGFTSSISIGKLRAQNETLISKELKYIEKYFPGTLAKYAKYHKEPLVASKYLSDLQRTLFEIGLSIRKAHSRISKWARRNDLEYHPLIKSKLEHHFAKIFDELNLRYTPQWPYKGYWYDFYLPDLDILIEIDGGGHSSKRDKIKDELANDLKIELIRFEIKDTNDLRKNYATIKDKVSKILGL